LYFCLRLYAQFRPVKIYVSRDEPIPAELAAELHMEEHKIEPMVRIESPYDPATGTIVAPAEIRRLRRAIAWSSTMPAFIDSLTILSPTNVLARQTTKSSMAEYRLIKQGDHWRIESATRQKIRRISPK